jgi:predicted Zn-dependent protease with MMP-like domain
MEELVRKAIRSLPQEVRGRIKNTVICIEDEPSQEQLRKLNLRNKSCLLGLYEGVPLNAWGRGFGNNLPDKITIFRKAILESTEPEKLEEVIRDVVWHEISHHFGFDEEKARQSCHFFKKKV